MDMVVFIYSNAFRLIEILKDCRVGFDEKMEMIIPERFIQ
jgi:hypothetical protein